MYPEYVVSVKAGSDITLQNNFLVVTILLVLHLAVSVLKANIHIRSNNAMFFLMRFSTTYNIWPLALQNHRFLLLCRKDIMTI